jgi:hypothetical protein
MEWSPFGMDNGHPKIDTVHGDSWHHPHQRTLSSNKTRRNRQMRHLRRHGQHTTQTNNMWRTSNNIELDTGEDSSLYSHGDKIHTRNMDITTTLPNMATTKTQSHLMDISTLRRLHNADPPTYINPRLHRLHAPGTVESRHQPGQTTSSGELSWRPIGNSDELQKTRLRQRLPCACRPDATPPFYGSP